MNEITIVYNSQKSGYLAKCWNLTQALKHSTVAQKSDFISFRYNMLISKIMVNSLKDQSSCFCSTTSNLLNGLFKHSPCYDTLFDVEL